MVVDAHHTQLKILERNLNFKFKFAFSNCVSCFWPKMNIEHIQIVILNCKIP